MNSLVSQIAMVVLALGILVLYVRPTFINIGATQDSIEVYKSEREKVLGVNKTLADLVAKADGVTKADQQAMLTYLPDFVDSVEVSRDILLIAETAEIYLRDVTYDGVVQVYSAEESDVPNPLPHSFSLDISGTYEQTKLFLSLLEQNNYPLEVRALTIVTAEDGLMDTNLTLFTYSHKQPI